MKKNLVKILAGAMVAFSLCGCSKADKVNDYIEENKISSEEQEEKAQQKVEKKEVSMSEKKKKIDNNIEYEHRRLRTSMKDYSYSEMTEWVAGRVIRCTNLTVNDVFESIYNNGMSYSKGEWFEDNDGNVVFELDGIKGLPYDCLYIVYYLDGTGKVFKEEDGYYHKVEIDPVTFIDLLEKAGFNIDDENMIRDLFNISIMDMKDYKVKDPVSYTSEKYGFKIGRTVNKYTKNEKYNYATDVKSLDEMTLVRQNNVVSIDELMREPGAQLKVYGTSFEIIVPKQYEYKNYYAISSYVSENFNYIVYKFWIEMDGILKEETSYVKTINGDAIENPRPCEFYNTISNLETKKQQQKQ